MDRAFLGVGPAGSLHAAGTGSHIPGLSERSAPYGRTGQAPGTGDRGCREAGPRAGAGSDPGVQASRGVAYIPAVTIAVELGNITSRFDSARKLMGYCGVFPSEDSSGKRIRKGGITKTGNAHLRQIVVESAWSYRHRPCLGAKHFTLAHPDTCKDSVESLGPLANAEVEHLHFRRGKHDMFAPSGAPVLTLSIAVNQIIFVIGPGDVPHFPFAVVIEESWVRRRFRAPNLRWRRTPVRADRSTVDRPIPDNRSCTGPQRFSAAPAVEIRFIDAAPSGSQLHVGRACRPPLPSHGSLRSRRAKGTNCPPALRSDPTLWQTASSLLAGSR